MWVSSIIWDLTYFEIFAQTMKNNFLDIDLKVHFNTIATGQQ